MLLALDTSTTQTGLALYDGTRVVAESLWIGKARQTEELAPAVAHMFAQTGKKMSDLTGLGVALGPGSFTSLRVGLAFVKGLAFSLNLPLIGIPTLDVVAAPVAVDALRPLACVLAAGRGRLALGWYKASENGWQGQGEPLVTTAETVAAQAEKPIIIAGELSAAERLAISKNDKIFAIPPALATRRPGILAELAWRRLEAGSTDAPASLAPIYLHIGDPIPG